MFLFGILENEKMKNEQMEIFKKSIIIEKETNETMIKTKMLIKTSDKNKFSFFQNMGNDENCIFPFG